MMTEKEKAKAYDEAIEYAKYLLGNCPSDSEENKLKRMFPELKESKDERIRKTLIKHFEEKLQNGYEWAGISVNSILAWLEKQGEHANFINKIQIGDKVTRNEDGVLVNLSQLNRVAKKDEKQGEQKPVEWSEEDERMLGKCINAASGYYDPESKQEMKNWLKSLRPQNRWKPSEYEIQLLKDVTSGVKDPVAYGASMGVIINGLEQLKAL